MLVESDVRFEEVVEEVLVHLKGPKKPLFSNCLNVSLVTP